MIKVLEATVGMSSVFVVMAQSVPGVPEDLKSWPVTAIIGLIALTALMLLFLVVRGTYKSTSDASAALAAQNEISKQVAKNLDEVAMKLGNLIITMSAFVRELRVRPCLKDTGHLDEDDQSKGR